jgi:hypothetical protein
VAGGGYFFAAEIVVDADMGTKAVGNTAVNPALKVLAQEWAPLEWGGRGGELVWSGCRLPAGCSVQPSTQRRGRRVGGGEGRAGRVK